MAGRPVQFDLAIRTDNAAFNDGVGVELARILREIAADLEKGNRRTFSGRFEVIRDINGNTVGHLRFS